MSVSCKENYVQTRIANNSELCDTHEKKKQKKIEKSVKKEDKKKQKYVRDITRLYNCERHVNVS